MFDAEHPLFASTEYGGLFPKCCSCSLPFSEQPYQISKHYQKGECMVEFAICLDCNMNLVSEFSDESRAYMQSFNESEIDFEIGHERHAQDPTIESWVATCNICGVARESLNAYSLNARFIEHEVLQEAPPLCLCEDCEVRYAEGLSKKTRDARDDFMKNHVTPDPAEARTLPTGPKPVTA